MKIEPIHPAIPKCPRCKLPAYSPHATIETCLSSQQAAIKRLATAYDGLKAQLEGSTKGMNELVRLLWKVAVTRTESKLVYTKAEIDAIPAGANVTVRKGFDGSLTATAVVLAPTTPQEKLQ